MKALLDLFLKANCLLCQRSTPDQLCPGCLRQLQHCQLPPTQHQRLGNPVVWVWGAYEGSLKRAIATLKYEHQPELARPLGHCAAAAWLAHPPLSSTELTVVPIPLHVDKQKQRGYNQAALLARSFCDVTGLWLQEQGLVRTRATEAQFGLSVTDREENLTAAFSLGKGLKPHSSQQVLLFDDIYTTGATARAATQALHRQGIRVLGLVAIASSYKDREVPPSANWR